jgi:hypothetical protein
MLQYRRNSRGQSLVEVALAMPLLILLFGGIVSFGFFLYAHVQVANATREAARAGSLYLSGRFHYTVDNSNNAACWTLREWTENALVERGRGTSGNQLGCPSGVNSAIHSFGLLSPTECVSVSTGSDCWWLTLSMETGTPPSGTFADVSNTNTTAMPVVGNQLKAQVTYRYNIPLLGAIFQLNPIPINKVVIMRVQNV